MIAGLDPRSPVTLRAVHLDALRADPAHALARTAPLALTDLVDEGDGWLAGFSRAAGAPMGLSLFVHGARGEGWVELDAFALATVYQQVIWDDRAWSWHAESGRADSAERMRQIHDLALRAYRGFADGERLVLAEG